MLSHLIPWLCVYMYIYTENPKHCIIRFNYIYLSYYPYMSYMSLYSYIYICAQYPNWLLVYSNNYMIFPVFHNWLYPLGYFLSHPHVGRRRQRKGRPPFTRGVKKRRQKLRRSAWACGSPVDGTHQRWRRVQDEFRR